MPEPIRLAEKLAQIRERWSPRVIAELNDLQFKLAKLEGEFVWHVHEDTDEAFLVVHGELEIELEDVGCVTLGPLELFVVKKGVRHIRARRECHVLILEPRGVVNTGDAGGALTAPNDVWV